MGTAQASKKCTSTRRTMQSGENARTKTVQCKYFLHGACTKGENCPFSHELATSKPNMVCRYFQAGHCAYGDKCRYDHIKAAPNPAEAPKPSPSKPSLGG